MSVQLQADEIESMTLLDSGIELFKVGIFKLSADSEINGIGYLIPELVMRKVGNTANFCYCCFLFLLRLLQLAVYI